MHLALGFNPNPGKAKIFVSEIITKLLLVIDANERCPYW